MRNNAQSHKVASVLFASGTLVILLNNLNHDSGVQYMHELNNRSFNWSFMKIYNCWAVLFLELNALEAYSLSRH